MNQNPQEVSTRDAALAKHFYGGPGDELESRLSSLEGVQATLLRDVEANGSDAYWMAERAVDLAHLLVSLENRTRAMRDGVEQAFGGLLEAIGSMAESGELLNHINRMMTPDLLREEARKVLSENMGMEPGPQMEAFIEQLLENPEFSGQLEQFFASTEIQGGLVQGLVQAQESIDLPGRVERAHQAAVSKAASDGYSAKLEGARWVLAVSEESSLVLGDSVAVAVGADGSSGSTLVFSRENLREVYLPIGPCAAIVALHHEGPPTLSMEEVARASVRLSRYAVYAHDEELLESLDVDQIGSDARFLGQGPEGFLRDSWSASEPAPKDADAGGLEKDGQA